MWRLLHFINKQSLVPIELHLFKWGKFYILSPSCNLTSDDLWSWYMTFDHMIIQRVHRYVSINQVLPYIPTQSCRNKIFSAREPNICSLNYSFSKNKLIQKSVSMNKSCKCWFFNFIGVLYMYLTIFNGSIMFIYCFFFKLSKNHILFISNAPHKLIFYEKHCFRVPPRMKVAKNLFFFTISAILQGFCYFFGYVLIPCFWKWFTGFLDQKKNIILC